MEANQSLKEEFVPVKSRIWVSAADGACATLGGLAISGAITYYFTEWRGLDAGLAAIVWMIFAIWNSVNDPLFGYISDRTRSKLGRRIPYIRFGAPIFAAAFIACWVNWPGTQTDQTFMFIQFLLLLFIVDTLYTAIATSIYIMPYEMAVSNKARSSIFIWKLLFMVFSTAVPLLVFNPIKPRPGDDATTFQLIMTGIGIAMGLVIFFSTFFYEEKHFTQDEESMPFFKSLKECFKNRAFIVFEVLSFTVIYVQTGLMQGIFYYFDELGIPAVPLYLALVVGIVVGVILWVKKRDAWGVKRCLTYWCLAFAFGCFLLVLFGREVALATLGFLFVGIGFSGGMYLIPIVNGDVIDYDEHLTGLRREGMYAGVNSFITKPAISFAQSAFLGITASFGYISGLPKGTQTFQAQTGILIGWALVPAILLFLCFLVMRYFPLDGKEWEGIKKNLAKIHSQKEEIYLKKHGFKYISK